MPCLREKYHTTVKAGPDGKFLPENWECVNKCRLIHDDRNPAQKSNFQPLPRPSYFMHSHAAAIADALIGL